MDWIESHQAWFWRLAVASIAMLVTSPLVVGWLVVRLPADYFTDRRRHASPIWGEHAAFGPVLRIAKNLLGFLLAAAGVVMLVVPGQGLLTIVAGILLIDFPGKYRLERWLVTRRAVWRSINWLRRRARREPFASPR
jgi:hypothetical protein